MHETPPCVAYASLYTDVLPSVYLFSHFFVIFGALLLFRAGFRRHLHVGYNHWYLMHGSVYNCMRHNISFYLFNKDSMEHLRQVKQGHCGVFGVFVWQR